MVIRVLLMITTTGALSAYLLGTLEWRGLTTLPFIIAQSGIFGLAVPWVGMILLTHSTFRHDFPSNRPDSVSRVLRYAPLWSKLLPLSLALGTFGTISWMTGSPGMAFDVAGWPLAESWQRGLFFIGIALFWVIPIPILLACRNRVAEGEGAPHV